MPEFDARLRLAEDAGGPSFEDAARASGLSPAMVRHRMDTGRLPFREVDGDRVVTREDLASLAVFERERLGFSKLMGEDTDAQETARPGTGAPVSPDPARSTMGAWGDGVHRRGRGAHGERGMIEATETDHGHGRRIRTRCTPS